MSADIATRKRFADFLERLAKGKGSSARLGDWFEFAVTHYLDTEVEAMRRSVVRLGISWQCREWPDLNCEIMMEWANKLRGEPVAENKELKRIK